MRYNDLQQQYILLISEEFKRMYQMAQPYIMMFTGVISNLTLPRMKMSRLCGVVIMGLPMGFTEEDLVLGDIKTGISFGKQTCSLAKNSVQWAIKGESK